MKASAFSGKWEERLFRAGREARQEHGTELKEVWNVAQENVEAGVGDLTREQAQGWLRATGTQLRLTEFVFPCAGLVSHPKL